MHRILLQACVLMHGSLFQFLSEEGSVKHTWRQCLKHVWRAMLIPKTEQKISKQYCSISSSTTVNIVPVLKTIVFEGTLVMNWRQML